jgi:RNA polymerase sigma factor (sigma-70 family)
MTTVIPSISRTDAELVAASRGGNREAFGQIVRKYQSMISGLIYAACGDLHRSEDVAQETFISAWKSLSGLSDPAKLPAWLCQIARHRIADQFRESVSQKVKLQREIGEADIAADESPDRAMIAEENEILWRTLLRIPQPYRETLVLYYRQGRSTAEVAAAMETTDAGVRQRLARGRQMLREEISARLERNLAASAPGEEFSLSVIAALPVAAAASTTAAAAAQGSAAAKGGGMLLFLSTWLAPLMAFASLGLITIQSIRHSDSGRRKRFLIGYWTAFWLVIVVWVIACNEIVAFGHRRHWDYAAFLPALAAGGCLYGMALFGLMAWASLPAPEIRHHNQTHRTLKSFGLRFLFLAPLIYSGVGWLVGYAMRAGDALSAELIVAAAILGSAVCAWRASSEKLARNPIKMAFESWMLMVAIILLALDFRLRSWMAAISHLNLAPLQQRMPLWSINLFGAVLVLWMCIVAVGPRVSKTK